MKNYLPYIIKLLKENKRKTKQPNKRNIADNLEVTLSSGVIVIPLKATQNANTKLFKNTI